MIYLIGRRHVNASSNAQERVRHFLVRSDSLGSNKTLPDYLKDQGQFQTILKLDPLTRALEAIPKDEALELYVFLFLLFHFFILIIN